MFSFIVNGNRCTHVMPLDYAGLETHETWLGQKDDLYYKKEIQDYNSPKLGETKKMMRD